MFPDVLLIFSLSSSTDFETSTRFSSKDGLSAISNLFEPLSCTDNKEYPFKCLNSLNVSEYNDNVTKKLISATSRYPGHGSFHNNGSTGSTSNNISIGRQVGKINQATNKYKLNKHCKSAKLP